MSELGPGGTEPNRRNGVGNATDAARGHTASESREVS
jgi:hypothetical protein